MAYYLRILFLLLLVFSSSYASVGQVAERYRGKMTGLVADTNYMIDRVLDSAANSRSEKRPAFRPAADKGSVLSFGQLRDPRNNGETHVVLVEPPRKAPFLGVDADNDGTIGPEERWTFEPISNDTEFVRTVLLLPIDNPLFKAVPVPVIYLKGFKHPELKETNRVINQSVILYSTASVTIGGKDVLFQYPFDGTPNISTTDGLFGIDVDGDGKIRNEQFSLETSYATNENLVFRYGDTYLSTESIDLKKNEVVVRRREKSDYLRIEPEIGKEMPDFSFVDLEGKPRSLKEFRGKYLLVEFWGVWCIDCVRDMPYTVRAYDKFRSRGFEVLGLNWDDNTEEVRQFLNDQKATWPQARKDSIKKLTEVNYRIQEYPTTILLGPDGKVLELNQKSIQGSNLIGTLERILPKER